MGKQIVLYLADSTINGIVDIEIMNWAGKALKIPRNEIDKAFWPEGMSAGVYFLMCGFKTSKKLIPGQGRCYFIVSRRDWERACQQSGVR